MGQDFNHLKEWLSSHLEQRQLSVEEFSDMVDLSRASVYFYFQDKTRPDEATMARICTFLGVPLEEGLRQYTPRPRGRPRGTY